MLHNLLTGRGTKGYDLSKSPHNIVRGGGKLGKEKCEQSAIAPPPPSQLVKKGVQCFMNMVSQLINFLICKPAVRRSLSWDRIVIVFTAGDKSPEEVVNEMSLPLLLHAHST